MLLDKSTKFITAVLAGAITTSQPLWHVEYTDTFKENTHPIQGGDVMNGVTPVTIIGAPADNTSRIIEEIMIYNADTANVTVTLALNDGASKPFKKATLTPGQTLLYQRYEGWQVL